MGSGVLYEKRGMSRGAYLLYILLLIISINIFFFLTWWERRGIQMGFLKQDWLKARNRVRERVTQCLCYTISSLNSFKRHYKYLHLNIKLRIRNPRKIQFAKFAVCPILRFVVSCKNLINTDCILLIYQDLLMTPMCWWTNSDSTQQSH